MCLEQNFLVLTLLINFVNSQVYQYESPCPRTFEYDMDQNGNLFGKIGVYSFDEDVELNVELSVGNNVHNQNGQINLATPKQEVLLNIRNRRPIKYHVTFPRWESLPPKVTKITVNGQEVCSGPPLPRNGWFPVISTVRLQHKFGKVEPLSAPGIFIHDDNVIGNGNTRRAPNGGTFYIPQNNDGDQNTFTGGNFNKPSWDLLNLLFTTTSRSVPKSTTRRVPVNDLPFSNNPFLNGRGSSPTTTVATLPRSRTNRPQAISCGNPVVPNPLIINGKSVPKGAFPWLIAMFRSTGIGVEYKCAGSLVSSKHVITAAHCVTEHRTKTRIPPEKFLFLLGKLNIENLLIRDGEKMVGAEDIKVHPEYVPLNSDADLAVVILSEIIQFTNFIRPICLWAESDDLDEIVGQGGRIVGWGKDEHNNAMTAEPKQVTAAIVSQEECLRSSEIFKYITSSRTFCAGNRNQTGPCNGDSGSGFIMNRGNRWTLKGVVSLSSYDSTKQSCDLSNYVVFTDVSKFRDWLSSIIFI